MNPAPPTMKYRLPRSVRERRLFMEIGLTRSRETTAQDALECPPRALQRLHGAFTDTRPIRNLDHFDFVSQPDRTEQQFDRQRRTHTFVLQTFDQGLAVGAHSAVQVGNPLGEQYRSDACKARVGEIVE